MTEKTSILWFNRDLRLADNPALTAALAENERLLPLYILEDSGVGAAGRWWLHQSLTSLAHDLEARGSGLILRRGDSAQIIAGLSRSCGAERVYYNRTYEPEADHIVARALAAAGISAQGFGAMLMHDPESLMTGAGKPYRVFTPFWKKLREQIRPLPPAPPPHRLTGPEIWPLSDTLDSWKLRPEKPDWAAGFNRFWQPGEKGAALALESFLKNGLAAYDTARDLPARAGTSRLSPHLHFGEISPRRIWAATERHVALNPGTAGGGASYLRELGWREFCHHLLYHHPRMGADNLNKSFDRFPWAHDPQGLKAWQQGRTGYPIVDAGLRELWHSGWMHNRVRMIAASFLIKNLLIDWREGEKWFRDTLLDADAANNAAGWQWVAGSGADAAPFFRIFNPTLQSRKFDPTGEYIKRWLPELEALPGKYIHEPSEAPAEVLHTAGITLGFTYPRPIIHHATARDRALKAYQSLRV